MRRKLGSSTAVLCVGTTSRLPRAARGALAVLCLIGVFGWGGTPSSDAGESPRAQLAQQAATARRETIHITAAAPDGGRVEAGRLERRGSSGERWREAGLFVRRFGKSGSVAWTRLLSCQGSAAPTQVVVTAGGVCWLTGWLDGRLAGGPAARQRVDVRTTENEGMFLACLEASGTVRWMRAAHPSKARGDHVVGSLLAPCADRSCVVAGMLLGSATLAAGQPEETVLRARAEDSSFVARYRADGSLAWARSFGGRIDAERGAALTTAADGSCVVVGDFRGEATFGERSSNRVVLRARGTRDLFVARYGVNGALAWAHRAGGSGTVCGQSAALRADGACVLTGWLMGQVQFTGRRGHRSIQAGGVMDMFLACYDAEGALRWVRTAGGTGESYAEGRRIRVRPDGSCEITGLFGGTIGFARPCGTEIRLNAEEEDDAFIASFDARGRLGSAGRRALR